mmetsp:Transcript_24399/g.36147  ORF Transcript_24399/g.36147 Transcript_24399/m.36147 type:complete len:102 (+) Transcript_24399:3214-3519(+)
MTSPCEKSTKRNRTQSKISSCQNNIHYTNTQKVLQLCFLFKKKLICRNKMWACHGYAVPFQSEKKMKKIYASNNDGRLLRILTIFILEKMECEKSSRVKQK